MNGVMWAPSVYSEGWGYIVHGKYMMARTMTDLTPTRAVCRFLSGTGTESAWVTSMICVCASRGGSWA